MTYITVTPPEVSPPAPAGEAPAAKAQSADIAARVKREVERLRAQAESEARALGAQEGRAAAKAEAAAALDSALAALREARRQLETPLAGLEDDIAEMVTDLAFVLARHIIGVEVANSARSVRALVAQLVREAASERNPGQSIFVRLNPEDEKTMQGEDDPDIAGLIGDATISRGGAIVEIISSGDQLERIEWDATIEARLAALHDGLALRDEEAAQ